tara:strand:- start:204 stop:473 length:270 start_codon:yes stop_codon:yes gene_type:complete
MAFKMKGMPGIAGVKAEEDLKKELGTDTRTVGGRHTEIHDGKTVKPSYRDKMKQIERHLVEFKEGGATNAEVKAERKRLVDDLKTHVGK